MATEVELLQFRFSPYNEKVRWALDLKRIPHRRRSLLPGPHMATLRRLTGQTQTPVLRLDGVATFGSARILRLLERRFAQPRLIPEAPDEAAECERIERLFDDELGPRVRRAVLAPLLEAPAYLARTFADGQRPLTALAYRLLAPFARGPIAKGNGLDGPAAAADGEAAVREALDFVAAGSQRTGYLVGGRFTIADVTAASMLATVVSPPRSPMTRPAPMPAAVADFTARFASHPAAEWVRGIYRDHRGAAADFEGEAVYGGGSRT